MLKRIDSLFPLHVTVKETLHKQVDVIPSSKPGAVCKFNLRLLNVL